MCLSLSPTNLFQKHLVQHWLVSNSSLKYLRQFLYFWVADDESTKSLYVFSCDSKSFASSTALKSFIIITLSSLKIPRSFSYSQCHTCCRMWKLWSKRVAFGHTFFIFTWSSLQLSFIKINGPSIVLKDASFSSVCFSISKLFVNVSSISSLVIIVPRKWVKV